MPCCVGTCTLEAHSEPNPVVDVQPVKLVSAELTQRSTVLASVGDSSGRNTENTLQLVGRLLRRIDQKTAIVVDSARQKSVDESSGQVVIERMSDVVQLSKVKEVIGTDCGEMLVNRQTRCQQDLKNRDGA